MLLARRLAEAGVPMVAVHFNEMTICDGWDTHSKNFEACQTELLPMLDIQATVYHCMGLNPRQLIYDRSQRPWNISAGRVIKQLV